MVKKSKKFELLLRNYRNIFKVYSIVFYFLLLFKILVVSVTSFDDLLEGWVIHSKPIIIDVAKDDARLHRQT